MFEEVLPKEGKMSESEEKRQVALSILRLHSSENSDEETFNTIVDLAVELARLVVKPSDQFPEPSRKAFFTYMSREKPYDLIKWIESGTLKPYDLTYAAETLGDIEGCEALLVPVLRNLLDHEDAMVREGAIYGIYKQRLYDIRSGWQDVDTLRKLRRMAVNDPSPGVRNAAADVIEDLPEVFRRTYV